MSGLIIGLIIAVCVLLVLIVLAQKSKGGGLAANYSSVNQVVGVQSSTNIAEKVTWYSAMSLLVLVVFFTIYTYSGSGVEVTTGGGSEFQQEQLQDDMQNQQQQMSTPPLEIEGLNGAGTSEQGAGTPATTSGEEQETQSEGTGE
ncbi:MAG: preprotein translocase subunit SecG [Bacteroidales bacterium]